MPQIGASFVFMSTPDATVDTWIVLIWVAATAVTVAGV